MHINYRFNIHRYTVLAIILKQELAFAIMSGQIEFITGSQFLLHHRGSVTLGIDADTSVVAFGTCGIVGRVLTAAHPLHYRESFQE